MMRYVVERNHSGHGVENGPEETCTSRGEREGGGSLNWGAGGGN